MSAQYRRAVISVEGGVRVVGNSVLLELRFEDRIILTWKLSADMAPSFFGASGLPRYQRGILGHHHCDYLPYARILSETLNGMNIRQLTAATFHPDVMLRPSLVLIIGLYRHHGQD